MAITTTRRDFLKAASASAALSMTAATYARAAGANDRIRIALIGCGQRGGAHMAGVRPHAESQNVEVVAVCDPWRLAREEMAGRVKEWFGTEPKQFVSYRDIVAMDDVDAVMIASCDHQHTTHLKAVADAKKDVYCEKPLAMDFDKLKAACDAVKANNLVCQIGTQVRSMAGPNATREVCQSGIIGKINRIERCRNAPGPYWYDRVKDVKEEDVDWQEFLMDAPSRPFDPVRYSGWYGYRDYSDGPIPGLGSHFIDLVHYFTGAQFPTSAVCMGGIFAWDDEHKFDCPDQVQALWTYPEGFMASYSTNFGNGSGNVGRIYGERGVIAFFPWEKPTLLAEGQRKGVEGIGEGKDIAPVERDDHFLNWLKCLRSRETPHASIDAGYSHAVAVIMAMKACDTGKRQIYDHEKREIREG